MAKKGKSSDDEAKRRLEQTVSAFNSALMGSFATLKRADIAQLGKMSPDEFATKYCSSPLGVFDTKIKKQKLVFFGLAERRLEFLPVLSLLELKPRDSRIEAILEATDGVLDYTLATM